MNKITISTLLLTIFIIPIRLKSQSLAPVPTYFDTQVKSAFKFDDKKERLPRLFINGLSSVNTSEQLNSSLQATQSINFVARIISQTDYKCGIDLGVNFNLLNLKPTGVNKDSFDMNSLMFPESSNTGLMIAPIFHYFSSRETTYAITHRLSMECSYSLRQNKVVDLYQKNKTEQLLVGLKLSISHP